MVAIVGLVDTVALATVMPVVSIIVEPKLLDQYRLAAAAQEVLPTLSASGFVVASVSIAATFLCLAAALNIMTQRFSNNFGIKIQARLARDVMLSAFQASYLWHVQQNSAKLVQFFYSGVVRWGRDFIQRLLTMAQHLMGMLIPLGLVLVIAPRAGILCIIFTSAVGLALNRLVQPRIKRAVEASKNAADQVIVTANNAVSSVKEVKIACQEAPFTEQYVQKFEYACRTAAAAAIWQAIPTTLLALIGQLALLLIAALLWSSGLSHGEIAGQMALIVLVTSRVIPSANRFFSIFSVIWNSAPWVDEVIATKAELEKLNDQSKELSAPAPDDWQKLVLENVSFYYPGKSQPALDQVGLTIERGKAYGVVGSSGAGKSTLIDLLIGLYQPSTGRLAIDGTDLRSYDVKSWHRQIGYVPQFPNIADNTLEANVALGVPRRSIDRARVLECLELANLSSFVATLPDGVDTQVGDRGVRMSGGQRQRLAIARAFYRTPQILVLDEATSNLDTVSEREFQQTVALLRRKTTIIVVAHRLSTVKDCDCLFYLEGGRLKDRGTFDELKRSSPGFQTLAS